jgi:hypothetical protein
MAEREAKHPDLGPYFIVPKGLLQNGIAARVGASAVALYVALCEHANRKHSNVFSISDKSLASDTGVAERTIRDARTRLHREGLISFNRQPGHSYTYTLLNVKLSPRIPLNERLRQPKKPRALHSTERPISTVKSDSEVQQKALHPSGNHCYFPPDYFANPSGGIC